jgi:two-component SAPR family response regulator
MVGSAEYLTKPFTKDQLLRAVDRFARARQAADA